MHNDQRPAMAGKRSEISPRRREAPLVEMTFRSMDVPDIIRESSPRKTGGNEIR